MTLRDFCRWMFSSKPNYVHVRRASAYGYRMAEQAGLTPDGCANVASSLSLRVVKQGVFNVLEAVREEIERERPADAKRAEARAAAEQKAAYFAMLNDPNRPGLTRPEKKRRQR